MYDKHCQYTENPQENIESIQEATVLKFCTIKPYCDTHDECNVENQTRSEINFVPIILPPTQSFLFDCQAILKQHLGNRPERQNGFRAEIGVLGCSTQQILLKIAPVIEIDH